jgi:Tfp pilus assembly protein PilN
MATKEINLLQIDKLSPTEKRRKFLLKIGSLFLIVLYCLVVAIIFSYGLVVNREAQVVTKKIVVKKAELANLQELESLQFLVKQRLSTLVKLIGTEISQPEYKYLDSLVPQGVSLQTIKWGVSGEITFSGSADNAPNLASFLENLKGAVDDGKLAKSTLVSANRQEEGIYNFNFEILVD